MFRKRKLARGQAKYDEGHYAEAYAILLPLAKRGSSVAQGVVGSMLFSGMHREQKEQASDGMLEPDDATIRADQELAAQMLLAASNAGIGPASFNLAQMYVMGFGGGDWRERKLRAAALFRLAKDQGFTAFAWLTLGEGEGEPYFGILEEHAKEVGCKPPGEQE